ncbi:MAG: hypothetical protein ACKV0T_00030, partial [Planctomycetales bacterium]
MSLTTLQEITYSEAPQVDRDAGVIRSVRVLGRTSRNGREYSAAALQQAARLYEGLGVNLNHPRAAQSDRARDVEEGIGWLESVEVRDDGVYGDLHYFRTHPQAELVLEAAQRNPRRFGLSHHAHGRVVTQEGKLVVESVESVRSVDLVQNPATNLGLFESAPSPVRKSALDILAQTGTGLAFRADDPTAGLAAEVLVELPEQADPSLTGAAAIVALLARLLEESTIATPERLERAASLLEAYRGATHPATELEGAAPIAELRTRLERLETEAHCRALLEGAGRSCDGTRLESLSALADDEERLRLIETWPIRDWPTSRPPRPATSPPLN